MCGVIFGMDCARKVTTNLNWTIAIPDRQAGLGESPYLSNNSVKRAGQSLPSETDEVLADVDYRDSGTAYKSLAKLVHITDIHVDPYYEPGSEANCGEPLCCRATSGKSKQKDKAAGIWGDYRNCDTPVNTVRHVLKHINEIHADVRIPLRSAH